MSQNIKMKAKVPEQLGLMRLDHIAVNLFPDFSRSRLQQWIHAGEFRVDGQVKRAKDKLLGGELLEIDAQLAVVDSHLPQQMELHIEYEDEDILIINKPVGLVTHPAAGNPDNTLLNGLLFHCESLQHIPRAGIVHRLDKGTSGLMVVAKTLQSQNKLVDQLQKREITRQYQAIVYGVIPRGGQIDQPIGRHPNHRTKMAVREDGKPSRTHFQVLNRFAEHTQLSIKLESGRTHQIRVHMSHIRFPLVGDPLYGGTFRLPRSGTEQLQEELRKFERPALHACALQLSHPVSGESMRWERDVPVDMERLLELLASNG